MPSHPLTAARSTRLVPFAGWPIVAWVALLVGAAVLRGFIAEGAGEAGLRAAIRVTAQISFVLFTAAFVASSLWRLWPSAPSRWLLANRRYLGVSFGLSHFVHLLAIIGLAQAAPDFEIDTATSIFGGFAYVLIAAMVATSFDRSAAWLGRRRWKALHTTGVYYIWFIFAFSYVPRALTSPRYIPFALVLVAALALRLAPTRRRS